MSPVRLPVVLEKRLLKSELCWIKGIRQSHSNDPWVRKCVRSSFRVRVGARRGLGDGAFSRQERSLSLPRTSSLVILISKLSGKFQPQGFLGPKAGKSATGFIRHGFQRAI